MRKTLPLILLAAVSTSGLACRTPQFDAADTYTSADSAFVAYYIVRSVQKNSTRHSRTRLAGIHVFFSNQRVKNGSPLTPCGNDDRRHRVCANSQQSHLFCVSLKKTTARVVFFNLSLPSLAAFFSAVPNKSNHTTHAPILSSAHRPLSRRW